MLRSGLLALGSSYSPRLPGPSGPVAPLRLSSPITAAGPPRSLTGFPGSHTAIPATITKSIVADDRLSREFATPFFFHVLPPNQPADEPSARVATPSRAIAAGGAIVPRRPSPCGRSIPSRYIRTRHFAQMPGPTGALLTRNRWLSALSARGNRSDRSSRTRQFRRFSRLGPGICPRIAPTF